MAFRLVYTEFWNDPKVMEDMTPEDKYFYLYLLTNPCTNMIGVYRIVKKQMAFDLGYSIESVNSLMDRFENYHKLIVYDNETKEICIKHYGKYNLNRGGKPMLDCIKKDIDGVKNKDLLNHMVVHIKKPEIKLFIENYLSTSNDTLDDTLTTRGQIHNPNPNPNPKTKFNNESSVVAISNLDVFKYFEKCGFLINAKMMELISADIEVYSAKWLKDAAEEALKRGVINYNYVLSILKNWKARGRDKHDRTTNNKQNTGQQLRDEGIGFTAEDLR